MRVLLTAVKLGRGTVGVGLGNGARPGVGRMLGLTVDK